MKTKRNALQSLLMVLAVLIYFPVLAQQNGGQDAVETKEGTTPYGPNSIVRTVRQDKEGNIWMASWQGIFKYDGKSFTNITGKASKARFFSVLEDRKGNFWFASVGSGVYYYDGKSIQHFTTKEGLANNRVTVIYEDKTGNIWFGTEYGASRYDGKSFQNMRMKEGPPPSSSDSSHVSEVDWKHNDVNAIIEDKTGKFWFATRGDARVYDGKTFTTITSPDGKPFTNVRSIIKDKKGNIWLGGSDGLWRYDGSAFTNFTQKFVGYIYEDKKGNIWTSSESANDPGRVFIGSAKNSAWALSKYDVKTLSNQKPTVTEIANKPMIFGILEDDKGNIWFGSVDGVYRYDGKTVTSFNSKEGQK
jgi:ligand-binding sensor domain-containing protein